MRLHQYLEEETEWKYYTDDNYLTLNISNKKFKELFHTFIYSLPKKYSNKRELLSVLRKDKVRVSPKEFNAYIDGFDESRLEELIGYVNDAIDKWGHLS